MDQTHIRLVSLFSMLIGGCGPAVEDTRGSTSASSSAGNCVIPGTRRIAVFGDAAQIVRESPEQEEACMDVCRQFIEDGGGGSGSLDPGGECLVLGPVVETDDDDGGGTGAGSSGGTTVGSSGGTTDGTTDGTTVGSSGADGAPGLELECPVLGRNSACIGGRGHAGVLSDGRFVGPATAAKWLAEAAHEEAASVLAFEALAVELAEHGAPQSLVERALESARDERRHAELMTGLAASRGGTPKEVRFHAPPNRTLEDLATENAVEGCVRETWAALEATYQAHHATDPEVREVMQTIAADETRHAALALDLDRWFRSKLVPATRARVDTATRAAVARLAQVPRAGNAALGLPLPETARKLFEGLCSMLWETRPQAPTLGQQATLRA